VAAALSRDWRIMVEKIDFAMAKKALKDLSFLYSHGLFPTLLCLSHFPPLALFGIPVLIPGLPGWPVTEAYPRDL